MLPSLLLQRDGGICSYGKTGGGFDCIVKSEYTETQLSDRQEIKKPQYWENIYLCKINPVHILNLFLVHLWFIFFLVYQYL